jgi:hypothetical protein
MRAPATALFTLCLSCTLVVEGRIDEFEGSCADEEEAAKGVYDVGGDLGPARPIWVIAIGCDDCTTEDCVEACIRDADHTDNAITFECSACFADFAQCAHDSCQAECGPVGFELGRCRACVCDGSTCAADLDFCGGLESTVNCNAD